jgi:hypothetical protein
VAILDEDSADLLRNDSGNLAEEGRDSVTLPDALDFSDAGRLRGSDGCRDHGWQTGDFEAESVSTILAGLTEQQFFACRLAPGFPVASRSAGGLR